MKDCVIRTDIIDVLLILLSRMETCFFVIRSPMTWMWDVVSHFGGRICGCTRAATQSCAYKTTHTSIYIYSTTRHFIFQKFNTTLISQQRYSKSKTMQRLDLGDLGVIAIQLLLVYTTFLESTPSINFDPSIYVFLRFLYPWLFVLGIPLLVTTFRPVREVQIAVALVWGSSAILINATKYCDFWNGQSNLEICTHKCANSVVAGAVWIGLAVPIIYWRSWK